MSPTREAMNMLSKFMSSFDKMSLKSIIQIVTNRTSNVTKCFMFQLVFYQIKIYSMINNG